MDLELCVITLINTILGRIRFGVKFIVKTFILTNGLCFLGIRG